MATINYEIRGKSELNQIYLRLSISREQVIRAKTGYVISRNDWSKATNLPKQNDSELKNLKNDLENLRKELYERLNEATSTGQEISLKWVHLQIDLIQGKVEKTDVTRLVNFFDYYIKHIKTKVYSDQTVGANQRTISKYHTLKLKISAFEHHAGKHYYLKDIGKDFSLNFIEFLKTEQHLNSNSVGKYITLLKSVLNFAKNKKQMDLHPDYDQIEGWKEKNEDFVILTFDELKKISLTDLKRDALINARDWLILGCFIGQRVSDLLRISDNDIIERRGHIFIQITQRKTKKQTLIPVHPIAKKVLEKRDGKFPRRISDQKFNLHIKDVCKEAGLTEMIKGKKKDPESKRIKEGKFPKYELVTSHVCRRSFATNFYGLYPTALLMNVTKHSTEKQFLEYINKPPLEQSEQLAMMFENFKGAGTVEPQLNVIRKAN